MLNVSQQQFTTGVYVCTGLLLSTRPKRYNVIKSLQASTSCLLQTQRAFIKLSRAFLMCAIKRAVKTLRSPRLPGMSIDTG